MTGDRFVAEGVDVRRTLSVLGMLPSDPTLRLEPGRLDRATQTPDGPGTITAAWEPGGAAVDVQTHGPGAAWLLERAPGLLGLTDVGAASFEPATGPLRELWRRHPGLRVPRTSTLWHDLCWLIVQQRVQLVEAADQWRRLVRAYGTPAPGVPDLMVPPSADRLAEVQGFEFHRIGIERRRADTLRVAARTANELHRLVDRPPDEAARFMHALPGIGAWTTSTLAAVTWGDPDTVIVGDSGIPALVSWTLAHERTADDQRMLDLLEPFRPHRYRVLQLAFLGGRRPPRRQPRRPRIDVSRR